MYTYNIIFAVYFLAASAQQEESTELCQSPHSCADSSSLLQKPALPSQDGNSQDAQDSLGVPHVIGLRRESVPIYRQGKIASFKTSYSGVLSIGQPAQDFRVVFDTGSAHIVLPAVECRTEACTANHRRLYDQRKSITSLPINADGSLVHDNEMGEQVTIGFGTGEITGEFAKDIVCFGKAQTGDEAQRDKELELQREEMAALIKQESLNIRDTEQEEEKEEDLEAGTVLDEADGVDYSPMCVEMNLIVAVEMSTVPFKTFQFDGILGLSLEGLAMNRNFSTFDMLVRNGMAAKPHFGVFLTDGEDNEPAEVAMGGADIRRMLEPLSWSDVYQPELGYWIVPIITVRIDGVEQEVCKDGTCRGVVDTGTSHLGIPAPFDQDFSRLLQVDAGDLLDCRLAKAPHVEIDIPGKTIILDAQSYMRRLPLREGVSVSSAKGVALDEKDTNKEKILMGSNENKSTSKKCIMHSKAVICEAHAADMREDSNNDRFRVYQKSPREVCVERTDTHGAWAMDLHFLCPAAEMEEVKFGANYGPDETVCVRPSVPVFCDADAANMRKDPHNDTFEIFTRDDEICAKRTDIPGSWGLQLSVLCPRFEASQHQTGESEKDDDKIGEPEKEVVNKVDEAEKEKDANIGDVDKEEKEGKDEVNLQQQDAQTKEAGASDGTKQDTNDDKSEAKADESSEPEVVKRNCSPRVMAVRLPEPLGPKLFILGEPVLHRYYTVYDWENKRVGFSLANTVRNTMDPSKLGRGTLPKEVDMLLMQGKTEVTRPKPSA